MTLRARLLSDPDCEIESALALELQARVARSEAFTLKAALADGVPACAALMQNGAAVAARLPLPPKSVVTRLKDAVSRVLQNRLPIETEFLE